MLGRLQGNIEPYLTIGEFSEWFSVNKESFSDIEVVLLRVENRSVYPVARLGNCGKRIIHIIVFKSYDSTDAYHACPVIKLRQFLRFKKSNALICPYCLQQKFTPKSYHLHRKDCERITGRLNKPQKTILLTPKKGNHQIFFKNFITKFPLHYLITFDVESFLLPESRCRQCFVSNSVQCTHSHSTNFIKHSHRIYSLSAIIIDLYDESVLDYVYFEDENETAMIQFLNFLKEKEEMFRTLHNAVPKLSSKAMNNARKSLGTPKYCHICEASFSPNHPFATHPHLLSKEQCDADPIVLDHCHSSGRVLGYAHRSCNLSRNIRTLNIPVLAHNGINYDFNFVISSLPKSDWSQTKVKPRLLCKSGEKIRQIKLSCYSFRDSCEHIQSSLSQAVDEILPADHKFGYLKSVLRTEYPEVDESSFCLINSKLPYPYLRLNSIDSLNTKLTSLKPSDFDSDLNLKRGSTEDVEMVMKLAHAFDLKTLKCLTRLYNISDSCFLAETITVFAMQAYHTYKLFPLHFISTSSFSLNVALYSSKLCLELPTDPSQTEFLSASIRGGYAGTSTRFGEAARHSLNPHECPTYPTLTPAITMLDWNGLYASCMQYALPNGPYRWMESQELDDMFSHLTGRGGPTVPEPFSLNSLEQPTNNVTMSCILEVDVTFAYDEGVHNELSHFPPLMETREVKWDELSENTQRLFGTRQRYNQSAKKLIADLNDKEHYKVYLDTLLDSMLNKGVVLKRIHRGLAFEQSPYLRDYILQLTNIRRTSTSSLISLQAKLCKLTFSYLKLIRLGPNHAA